MSTRLEYIQRYSARYFIYWNEQFTCFELNFNKWNEKWLFSLNGNFSEEDTIALQTVFCYVFYFARWLPCEVTTLFTCFSTLWMNFSLQYSQDMNWYIEHDKQNINLINEVIMEKVIHCDIKLLISIKNIFHSKKSTKPDHVPRCSVWIIVK